jgi:hypothetical protein
MWLLLGIATLLVAAFLLALYLGEQKERPSPLRWTLSEGDEWTLTSGPLVPVVQGDAEAVPVGNDGVLSPSESFYDWHREAVFILPPTGPEVLVRDLWERTRAV